jgi:hypothetical protein
MDVTIIPYSHVPGIASPTRNRDLESPNYHTTLKSQYHTTTYCPYKQTDLHDITTF